MPGTWRETGGGGFGAPGFPSLALLALGLLRGLQCNQGLIPVAELLLKCRRMLHGDWLMAKLKRADSTVTGTMKRQLRAPASSANSRPTVTSRGQIIWSTRDLLFSDDKAPSTIRCKK